MSTLNLDVNNNILDSKSQSSLSLQREEKLSQIELAINKLVPSETDRKALKESVMFETNRQFDEQEEMDDLSTTVKKNSVKKTVTNKKNYRRKVGKNANLMTTPVFDNTSHMDFLRYVVKVLERLKIELILSKFSESKLQISNTCFQKLRRTRRLPSSDSYGRLKSQRKSSKRNI